MQAGESVDLAAESAQAHDDSTVRLEQPHRMSDAVTATAGKIGLRCTLRPR